MPDGSTITNGIDGYPADHSSNEQPDNHDATLHDSSHVHDGKADAPSDLGSQSPSDTDRSSASGATEGVSLATPDVSAYPTDKPCNTPDRPGSMEPHWQNANMTKKSSLGKSWLKELNEKDVAKRDTLSE